MLDAMITFALKRLLDKHIHFRKRVSVEEQRAQEYDRFLRGRQTACMIYEHFRASGAYDSQICSVHVCRLTTSKTSTFDVNRLHCQQATCPRKWSWKVYESQNYRTLFSFRLSWLCTIKKAFETMDSQVIYD